jgi:glutaminyl-tRNA synthetase
MAEAVTDSVAKLQLDPETGEMVSKNELKKRMQKRAKKAAAAAAPKKAAPENPKPKAHVDDAPLDPEAMFKQGFLAEVFKERPVTPTVTRFPPEPNGLCDILPWEPSSADCGQFTFGTRQGHCNRVWICKVPWRRHDSPF